MLLVTHNNRFHLDEVIATAILKKIHPDAVLKRSRDPADIASADIAYDVGGVYQHATGRYDHHQRGFEHTFSEKHCVKLSSAGLIYKHYHRQLLEHYSIAPEDWIVNDVYEEYIMYVDACDNGVENGAAFTVRTLADVVDCLNVHEKDKTSSRDERSTNAMTDMFIASNNYNDSHFLAALSLVSADMDRYFYKKKILADEVVSNHELVKNATDSVLVIEPAVEMSMDALAVLDQIHGKNILFVIYNTPGNIRIYAARKRKNSFESKIPLCPEWGGLRDHELQRVSGIAGATFVHATGFTGGASDQQSALEMCTQSISRHASLARQ